MYTCGERIKQLQNNISKIKAHIIKRKIIYSVIRILKVNENLSNIFSVGGAEQFFFTGAQNV